MPFLQLLIYMSGISG